MYLPPHVAETRHKDIVLDYYMVLFSSILVDYIVLFLPFLFQPNLKTKGLTVLQSSVILSSWKDRGKLQMAFRPMRLASRD